MYVQIRTRDRWGGALVGGLGLYCTRDWLVCILRVPSAGCVRCGASHSPGRQIVRRLVHLFKYDAHHCRQRSRRRARSALGSSSRGPPALALRTSFSPQIGAGVDQTEDGTDGLRFPRVRPPMPTCMGRAMATVNANATAGRERPRRARAAVARDDPLRFCLPRPPTSAAPPSASTTDTGSTDAP